MRAKLFSLNFDLSLYDLCGGYNGILSLYGPLVKSPYSSPYSLQRVQRHVVDNWGVGRCHVKRCEGNTRNIGLGYGADSLAGAPNL